VGNRNIANELLLRKYFHEKNSSIAIHPSFRKVQAHIFSPRLVPEEEDDTVHQPFEFGISDRWDNTNGQNSGQTSWAAEQQGNSKGFYPEGIVIPNCTVPSQSMGSTAARRTKGYIQILSYPGNILYISLDPSSISRFHSLICFGWRKGKHETSI
jgi:hypothetical protein